MFYTYVYRLNTNIHSVNHSVLTIDVGMVLFLNIVTGCFELSLQLDNDMSESVRVISEGQRKG